MCAEPAARSRYEVLTRIGVGGMASVYVGRARGAIGFTRLVAVKRPHPFVAAEPALVAQIEREARVASMIHHPNVVSVLDVEEIEGELALILDYVPGCTLGDLMKSMSDEGRQAVAIAVRAVLDAAAGLHAAHKLRSPEGDLLGLVHRDVSPQNVLVGVDGVARITDFGIAKVTAEAERTATEVLKGKLAYMAPEYVESRRFDARSDLFSLGVVAWEAFTGRRLFKGAVEVETMRNVVAARVPSPSSVAAELAPFDAVLAKALARDPADRHPTVAAFADELEAAARAHGWVASHEHVGAAVERVAGTALAARTRELEASASGSAPVTASMAGASPGAVSSSVASGAEPDVSGRQRPHQGAGARRIAVAAALAGVAVVAALGALALGRRGSQTAAVHATSEIAAPVDTSGAREEVDAAGEETLGARAAAGDSTTRSTGTGTGTGTSTSASTGDAAAPAARVRVNRHARGAGLVPLHAPPNPYATATGP